MDREWNKQRGDVTENTNQGMATNMHVLADEVE